MTISSINTNSAALLAQQNIGAANTATSQEVSQLSSGNRIVQASTDVAALSVGTALASQVNVLNTSLTVASEGSSLLQVADGALSQIQSILQQQQSVATQAQAGSLSTTQLGFLDEEFQNLTQQIDQLAGTTNFNGVNLLNGNISGNVSVGTNHSATGTTTTFSANNSGALLTIANTVANNDTVTIAGVKVTFTTSTQGTTAAAGKVQVGDSVDHTAQNLVDYLNNLGAAQFANLQFYDAGTGAVGVHYSGGKLAGAQTITTSTSDSTNITGTGKATISATSAANITDNVNGLTINRFSTSGTATGSLLANDGSSSTDFGGPLDIGLLQDNASFIGNFGGTNIGQITGTYGNATDTATFQLNVGGITYTSSTTNATSAGTLTGNTAGDITLTFTGRDSTGNTAGGSFKLYLQGTAISTGTIKSQSTLDPITAQLNAALSGVSVNQDQSVNTSDFNAGNIVSVGGVQVGNLQDVSAQFTSNSTAPFNLSSLTVSAPGVGGSDASFSAVINGDTYQSVSGIGNQIGLNTVIALQDTSNPNNIFTITTGNTAIANAATTTLDISSASNASAIQTALQSAFGLSKANAALSFQVGSTSTDTIGVSIGSSTTSSLFGGQALDVKTQADASTAGVVLTSALNTVTALRANVGALEQRFSYASNAITSTVQNEGAAKSTLLDTDVAATSTQFATSQVQLQAGIAVLAQANQLQQNLLKLIA